MGFRHLIALLELQETYREKGPNYEYSFLSVTIDMHQQKTLKIRVDAKKEETDD